MAARVQLVHTRRRRQLLSSKRNAGQKCPMDDVTDFKDFNDVPWMMSQFSNMLQMRQERFHRFHRCQIDYVTNLKIQRCLKDDLKDVTLMMSQNSQRCHR